MKFLIALVLLSGSLFALDAPTVVKRDQPTVIEHKAGEKINAIFAVVQDGVVTWQFLPDSHFIRTEEKTYLAAPPGEYVIVVGESQILKVVEEGLPNPKPQPKPDPPDPPDPDDDQIKPQPDAIQAEWVIWIEEQEDRTKNQKQSDVMLDPELRSTLGEIGLKTRIYDKDQASVQSWLKIIKDQPLPAMVIIGKDPDQYRVFDAPSSTADAESLIRGAIVR